MRHSNALGFLELKGLRIFSESTNLVEIRELQRNSFYSGFQVILSPPLNDQWTMAIPVIEFQVQGYRIRKSFS